MRGLGLEEDHELVEAMVHRLARRREELGLSIRQMAAKAGIDPTSLSRLERGERVPETRTMLRLVQAMDRTVEWAFGLVEPLPSVEEDGQTLLGFLNEVRDLGLDRWAATAPRDETPTLSEVTRAMRALKASPAYSTSSGVPTEGWGEWFRAMRATGFQPRKTPPSQGARGPSARAVLGDPSGHEVLRLDPSAKRREKPRR
jgi:transcriptional regulator with XRE-family HTH domain